MSDAAKVRMSFSQLNVFEHALHGSEACLLCDSGAGQTDNEDEPWQVLVNLITIMSLQTRAGSRAWPQSISLQHPLCALE